MRHLHIVAGMIAVLAAAPAAAQEIRREAGQGAPIANSVELPPGSRLVYVSGTVPSVANLTALHGSMERYGDTAAQTRSLLRPSSSGCAPTALG